MQEDKEFYQIEDDDAFYERYTKVLKAMNYTYLLSFVRVMPDLPDFCLDDEIGKFVVKM